MTPETKLAALARVAADLAAAETKVDDLRAQRLALFADLREASVTHARIGEAAGVSEVAVIQALRKDKAKRAKAAAPPP